MDVQEIEELTIEPLRYPAFMQRRHKGFRRMPTYEECNREQEFLVAEQKAYAVLTCQLDGFVRRAVFLPSPDPDSGCCDLYFWESDSPHDVRYPKEVHFCDLDITRKFVNQLIRLQEKRHE
jgi:hypothetical protein